MLASHVKAIDLWNILRQNQKQTWPWVWKGLQTWIYLHFAFVLTAGNRGNDEIYQPGEPGCVPPPYRRPAGHRHVLHRLVFCVSLFSCSAQHSLRGLITLSFIYCSFALLQPLVVLEDVNDLHASCKHDKQAKTEAQKSKYFFTTYFK